MIFRDYNTRDILLIIFFIFFLQNQINQNSTQLLIIQIIKQYTKNSLESNLSLIESLNRLSKLLLKISFIITFNLINIVQVNIHIQYFHQHQITKYDCSKLFGTQSSHPAYCTNAASGTSACVSRKCSDNTDATDNTTCNGFLPGCITNGQGCVVYNTPSISMKGTQAICDKLQAEQFQAFEKINVITHQVILQQIISKLKLVLLLKTRLIAHVDHFQKVVFKMVMEGVLIQKQQLVLVILELQHFAKMQLLESIIIRIMQDKNLHRQYNGNKR
ncbi:unnamed protein product [Paramecium sonneborni]|uniref:Uncharacterized protein n=1 Tax=Paramecium sonneborni TaxID=65129 RepID=A0A8S1RED9_9CILI|nr:unnamed protein product [Paramecium sonneborni]